ncbi:tRNA pseudouridine synthase A (tRNA-uridine isomerase I) (tRNA pseudouridylate synthase I) [Magnetospirillum gryphiswaldense MSR-1 v2]|uniref:tRNA pseudouridine synthase A n=1 Tax=Magnetospirillum gryphiswaldense (strain DSM 6361 / JCM 21280 / NBRC 15271 / MSR-1) TaxID=431944 RepID=V6F3Y1_MAGGM|nr:tRNA pseudouridine(38-40) synthase TruA [Magnetospirillum gryphiswaldense]CDL00230.1 tRNA pseudouridine synthase A (tRNA-uridine isomerase I) (tRNA pseudouridylate synthase I) [Magnetospirillum gryphiswaldense MSR-1 v2]
MPRFKLRIEYHGTPFVGWQRQDNGISVQGELEAAIFRFCGLETTVTAAGRTDAGVHATGQVIHFDLDREVSAERVQGALNYHLKPHPIAVRTVEIVPDDFHARFSALGRSYLYRIVNRRAPVAIERERVWWVSVPLDAEAMQAAARHLLGRHDFTSFRAAACQAQSPDKTLDLLQVTRTDEEIRIVAEARSFLHHQVRNMVGTLKLVGEGKWHPDRVKAALEARDRAAAGPTAPPDGLYLTGVVY